MALHVNASVEIPASELQFEFSRSSGPGGQNVNKVESRVDVLFNIAASRALTDVQKQRLLAKLSSRIDSDGNLRVTARESRSQFQNRDLAIKKLAELLRHGLKVPRKRVATKPSRQAKEERLKRKKSHSAKKQLRGRVRPE